MATTAYPFDPQGNSSLNRITNEKHVLTSQNYRDYHYIIPDFAPFALTNFKITITSPSGVTRQLYEGIDYYFSNKFRDASLACAKEIYGSISFLDTDTFGIVNISYNTIGGIWTLTPQEISRILAEEMRNPRVTAWEQVTQLPQRFPVVDHEWDLVDLTGAKQLVDATNRIADAITQKGGGSIDDHINNFSNPHQVTKVQVGLGNLQNYAIATAQQAADASSNSLYMTPIRTLDTINASAGVWINTHINNTNNPHQTTATQVGLGNVQNYGLATQAIAEAGTSNAAYMTPLSTKQAITAIGLSALNTHIADKSNPHQTDKSQIGLANVQNYAVASQEEARAGTATDKYMTPQRTRQLVLEYVTVELGGHASRTDNPHQVTAAQVGLGNVQNYAIASLAEAQTGTNNATYMTPARTKQAIDAQVATPLANHINDTTNPHSTTATQVGLGNVQNYAMASNTEAIDGTAVNRYMSPALVKTAISQTVGATLTNHVNNSLNPHNTTSAQVGLGNVQNYAVASLLEAQAGTSNTVYMTALRVADAIARIGGTLVNDHATNTANPHNTNATQVGLGNVQNYAIATDVEAKQGVSNAAYMTPYKVAMAITALATPASHVTNTSNPHSTTAAQVGAFSKEEITATLNNYVTRTDTWVSGQRREDFVAFVRSGTVANSDALSGVTLTDILRKTAATWAIRAFDIIGVIDPVAKPYHWLNIGRIVSPSDVTIGGSSSPAASYPDGYWFVAGGAKLTANTAESAGISSPGYLLHAVNSGINATLIIEATRLNNGANTVAFGATVDNNKVMNIWMRVAAGYSPVALTQLSGIGVNTVLSENISVDVEPVNIIYATITNSGGDVTALAARVAALEAIITGVTVV